jgi:hypothetical protein
VSKSTFDPRLPTPTAATDDPANALFYPESFFQRSWIRINTLFKDLHRQVYRTAHPPVFVAQKTMVQAVPGGATVESVCQFDTVVIDTHSYWDATDSRYVPARAGYYEVRVNIGFEAAPNVGDASWMYLRENGTQTYYADSGPATDTTNQQVVSVYGAFYCNGTTDYLDVAMKRTVTGHNTTSNPLYNILTITYLGEGASG